MESWFQQLLAQPFSLLLLFCMSLLLIQAVRFYQWRRGLMRALQLFPGSPAHWFYGHMLSFPAKQFERYDELVKNYPCASPLWFGPFYMSLFVYDPDYIKMLLTRKGPKTGIIYKFIEASFGQGILTLNGSKWQQHRKIMRNGLSINFLRRFATTMSENITVMLDKWEKLTTHDPHLEITEHVALMTLDNIMKCAFSQKNSTQRDKSFKSYIDSGVNLNRLILHRVYSLLYRHDLIFHFTSQRQIFSKSKQVIHQYAEKVIQDRKESLQNKLKEDTTQKRHEDLLDILLHAKDENQQDLSEEDILAEVKIFMFAGFDTTSSAISWILYCMAKYPEHQQRCRDEVRGLLGDEFSITWEHLNQMSYITMCIKECLRLYPPIVNLTRELKEPITFPDGRYLPAGVTTVVSIWALHHNPDVWKDPQVFNPLRFSQENSEKNHPYGFLPFSTGLRNCIGQQFAMLECKMALALTLLRFELALDLSMTPILTNKIVLKSKNGIHLLLKKIC